jgi:hypothetical protein
MPTGLRAQPPPGPPPLRRRRAPNVEHSSGRRLPAATSQTTGQNKWCALIWPSSTHQGPAYAAERATSLWIYCEEKSASTLKKLKESIDATSTCYPDCG